MEVGGNLHPSKKGNGSFAKQQGAATWSRIQDEVLGK